jgi:hypothetical protein
LGKFLGIFLVEFDQKQWGIVYFSCFTSAIKSLFIQSGRPQLLPIQQKSRDL